MARLLRLEALLGAPLDQLTEDHVAALAAGAVREDTDLDFKLTLYGNSESEHRKLAGDVAAMANTLGGALLLGVEDVDAVATSLQPVALSDAEERRMRQIVAGNCAPHVPYTIHRVPTAANPAEGFYVLEVPRSPAAPHAVVVGTGLRYPRRDGASTRWLIESEVADAYRSRFASAHKQQERLEEVRRQGEAALPEATDHAWLSLALVPNTPGLMEISLDGLEAMRNYPRSVDFVQVRPTYIHQSAPWVSTGHRRVVLNLGQRDDGWAQSGVLHLHQDGAVYVGVSVGSRGRNEALGEWLDLVWVNDENLTQELIAALAVAAAHAALNAGTGGDAVVEAALFSAQPMVLNQDRSFRKDGYGPPVQAMIASRHTISIEDVLGEVRSHLAVTRMVMTDLVQSFGLAEPLQLTRDGDARLPYWHASLHARLRQEAERRGFAVVD